MNNVRKKVLIMAITLINFCSVFSQTLQLRLNQVTVKEAMTVLKEKSGYSFVYEDDDFNTNEKITVNANNLNVAIEQIIGNQNVSYEIKGDNIILKKNAEASTPEKRTITGYVLDNSGHPIIGATIMEKGTSNGTVSDMDGRFALNVDKESTLQISYIGFVTKSVKSSSGKNLTITLSEDQNYMEEIVVVGYGTMKKKDLTGAVASVKMDDTPIGTISTVSHALAGKAAGLQVNTVSAQPGGGATFRIRGAASVNGGNDPLIIVDGFPVNSSGDISVGNYDSGSSDNILASINPNDIQSIEILKDASATAIYGARAGHGVIIVTTKKGKEEKTKVNYSSSVSVQSLAKNYEVLNAKEFMTEANRYLYENWMYTNKIGIYGGNSEADAKNAYSPKYTEAEINSPVNETDWIGEVTRTGVQTVHNLSITGGTEKTHYMISGNFFLQNGVVKGNDLNRYTGRINLEQEINKHIKTGINLTLSRINSDNVPLGSRQNEHAGILVSAAQFNPTLGIKDEAGNYMLNSEAAFLPNPVSLLEAVDQTTKERLLGTVYVEYKPFKDLILKGNFGIDRNYQRRETYLPKTTLYGQKKNGSADIGQYDKSDYLLELTANYNKIVGNHSLNALVGYSFQRFTDKYLRAANNDFVIDGFEYNNLGAGANPSPTVGSSASLHEMASFFGRLNYVYADKYMLTATLRADGASNFAENNKWGYFPSLALGWRFKEEKFVRDLSWLSNGKLRVSYGQTGNSNVGNKAVSFYSTGYNNEFGSTKYTGVYLSQLGNPELKWETTTEWNVGIDLGFFDNRISLTAEYFNRNVSDLLNTQSLMSYYEVNRIMGNVGKTQSKGFELTINTNNISTKDFEWNSTVTFSLYRDKWKERDEQWKPSAYDQYNSPIRYYSGYLSDGLIQAGENVPYMNGAIAGQVKMKDINGYVYNEDGTYKVDKYGIPLKSGQPDGKLDDADKVIYGSSDPGYIAGFNNTLRYKNFDLNIYFYGQFDQYNNGSYKDIWLTGANGMTSVENLYRGYNMPISAKDVWTHDNTSASRPGYFQGKSAYGYGDYFLKKIWFIRCRNITLGYNIPVGRKTIKNFRVYVDANNLFCLTPYDGLDPETDNSAWAYPNVRSFTFGVDITF